MNEAAGFCGEHSVDLKRAFMQEIQSCTRGIG
jgi:hypothetical protein